MALRVRDISEVVYGGAVTAADWWDAKRIAKGTLMDKEVYKKAGFWVYLGIGIPAILMSTFGWMRRYEGITEKLATGFLYDLPRVAKNTVKSLSKSTSGTGADESLAVKQAQAIINRRMGYGGQIAERSADAAQQAAMAQAQNLTLSPDVASRGD